MELRQLGSLRVPTIGMGTWKTFDVRSDSDIAVRRRIVNECIAHGVTFVDSSPMYGRSEGVIGKTIAGRRDQFQLATKVWTEGKSNGEAEIACSFQLLGADYIDVFQVHNLLDWRTHLATLERLKEQGKVRLVGITHYDTGAYPAMLEIMKTGRIDTVQIPYNVGERECEAHLLPLAEELGIGVIVMQPLGEGRYVSRLRRQPDLAPLAGTGIRMWAQALLAWVLGDPRVSVAIPATSRPERIAENAQAGSGVVLDDDLRDYIRQETIRCQ